VWLHYVDGLSYDELSSITGVTPGAMRVQSHRARRLLQRELEEERPRGRQRRTTVEAEIAEVWMRMRNDGSFDPVMRNPRWAVELREREGPRSLLIFIGNEANGIAMQLAGVEPPRPQTYAFTARLLAGVEARVERVTVTDLIDDGRGIPGNPITTSVFLAHVALRTGGRLVEVDARPSDALNLALSARAPLHVAEAVMDKKGILSAEVLAKLDGAVASRTPPDEPDGVELEWRSEVEAVKRRNAEGRMPWNRARRGP
jgi:bifunctional DNase/RNase